MSKRITISGLATALILLAGGAVAQTATNDSTGAQWTQAGESGAALPEMVVEAQNKVRQQIEKTNFAMELSAAVVDTFYTPMDDQALGVSPVSGLQPYLNNLEPLSSDQPPHCWLPEMTRTPVATFYPGEPEGHKIKQWNLTVTDFRGSPCRTYQGGGNPPKAVSWDGHTNAGEILRVGYPYSYVFQLTDKGTNTYNYAGASFRIPALDYRRDGDRMLEIAGGEIFAREQSELTDSGKAWLTRAADEIRRHPYSPVRVTVTAETKDLAARRADAAAGFLATTMILPREQVETEAVQKADLRAEMDGTVAIAIQHAD